MKHYLVILFVCLLAFVGCKGSAPLAGGTHQQTRDSIRTEYIHDSIYIDRWHREYTKGDTVYVHDSIDRWRNKFVYIHDSIDLSRTDTIYNTVEVEKKQSKFLRNSGIALWVLIGVFLIAIIVGIILKFAK